MTSIELRNGLLRRDEPETVFHKVFSKVQCDEELKESMNKNFSLFCNSNSFIPIEGENFIECYSCIKDYCSTCFKTCHSNLKCSREKREFEDDTVYEFSSACHCSHNIIEKSQSEMHLLCFYTKFLSEYYELENNESKINLEDGKNTKCYFCQQNCKYYIYRDDNVDSEDRICKCIDPTHFKLDLLDLLDLFRNTYSRKAKKPIVYKEIVPNLKEGLRIHFDDISDKAKKEKFIEFQSHIFSIHNIMRNGKLEISYEEEKQILLDIIKKSIDNDNFLQNRAKINFGLTYIFHFYKKYFFSQIEMITVENINLLSNEGRQEIMKQNTSYLEHLRKNSYCEKICVFHTPYVETLFSKLPEKKHFSLKINNEENNVPFLIYFIKLFYESYCFFPKIKEAIPSLFLNRILFSKIQFKKNCNNYNILLRKYFDEAMYLSQITHLDVLSEYSTYSRLLRLNSLSDTYYFKSNEGMNANLYKRFFRLMFYDEDSYLLNTQIIKDDNYNQIQDQKEPKKFNMINQESLLYLNCLNNKFILAFIEKIKNSHLRHILGGELKNKANPIKGSISGQCSDQKQKEMICKKVEKIVRKKDEEKPVLSEKDHILFFKNIAIEWIKETEDENKVFKSYIDLILDNFDLNNDLRNIDNKAKFMDYLFFRLKASYTNIQAHFKIDISQFLKRKRIINFSEISLRPFEKEIKFIFYKMFNLEFYKTSDFSDYMNKWNLLLFLFFCNRDNSLFILSDMNYLKFLLQSKHDVYNKKGKLKSFLTYFLNYENTLVKENNFIWKIFYIAVKHFVHGHKELADLKLLIIEKFINVIINFYCFQNNNNYENGNSNNSQLKSMNHCLVYYFFKITNKILIRNDLSSCLPYDFNVNKFEIFEKIISISKTFFETELDFNKYFESKLLFEFSDSDTININTGNDQIFNEKYSEGTEEENHNKNIELMNIDLSENKEKQKKESRKVKYHKITLGCIQILLLDILASFNSTTDLNVYFQIINNNLLRFIDFFKNKNKFQTNKDNNFDSFHDIFKVEIILLKFLFNFLTIRVLDFSKIEMFYEITINNEDLKVLRNYIINSKNTIIPVINLKDNPALSKYLVSKMKIQVWDSLCDYLKYYNGNFYQKEKYNNALGYFFINHISLFFKNLEIMKKKKDFIYALEKHFLTLTIVFYEEISKFFSYLDNLCEISSFNYCLNLLEISEKDISHLKKPITRVFRRTQRSRQKVNFLKKFNTNFFGCNTNIEEYFRSFVLYDYRKYSKYSKLVNDFILRKLELKKMTKEYKKNLVIYLIEKHSSFKIKKTTNNALNQNIDGLNDNYLKIKKKKESMDFTSQILFDFWCETNQKLSKHNSEDLNKLLKYLFNSLNHFEEYENMNLDNIFSENFLKTLNFFNNLLYHNPLDFQESIFDFFTDDRMKILLRNVLKLNNYIIGISNYETNERLMSLSKIYFTLMDFFILLQEGSSTDELSKSFFMDLTINDQRTNTEADKMAPLSEKINIQNSDKVNFDDSIRNEINLNPTNNQNHSSNECGSNLDERVNIRTEDIFMENLNFRKINNYNNQNSERNKEIDCDNNFNLFASNLDNDTHKELKITISNKIRRKDYNEFNINQDFNYEESKIFVSNLDEIRTNSFKNNLNDEHISNKFNNLEPQRIEEAKELNDSQLENQDSGDDSILIKNVKANVKKSNFDKNNKKIHFLKNGRDNVNNMNQSIWIECNGESNYFEHGFTKKNISEEGNYKNNFYYYSFLQLVDILRKINKIFRNEYEDFSHGSSRLTLQCLYICRFLREYIEIEDSKENLETKKIINYCFKEIFDLDFLMSYNYQRKYLSLLLRYELVNLLNVYLEESDDSLIEIIIEKFNKQRIDFKDIFFEIKTCFEEITKSIYFKKGIVDRKFEKMTYEFLLYNYLEDEDNFYNNKYFELAESYYRLLRLMDPFYKDLKGFIGNLEQEENKEWQNLFESEYSNRTDKEHLKILIREPYRTSIINSYKFIIKVGREIEIKFLESNDKYKLRKIFFFINPKCFFIDNTSKINFMEKTPRANLGEKLDYFNKKLDKFLLNINACYKYRSSEDTSSQSYLLKYSNFINFSLVLILNILLLIYCYANSSDNSFQSDLNSQKIIDENSQPIVERINYVFYSTIVVSFLQLILISTWFYYRFKIKVILGGYKSLLNKKYLLVNNFTNEKEFKLESLSVYNMMKTNFSDLNTKYLKMKTFDTQSFWKMLKIRIKVIYKCEVYYIIFTLIFNILYLITNYKLLLVIPVTSITKLYSLFDYFYTAMKSKYKEFVALLIFIYFVEYIFSWISFLHFQDFMIAEFVDRSGDLNENEPIKELMCSTAIECFLNYLHLGLRLGGGIGDSSPRLSFKFQSKDRFFLKIFWDIVFHIIVNLILSNIFFGVIVDTFNDLRNLRDVNTEDKNNKCFMCMRTRYDSGYDESFDYHRQTQHNVFDYVYFIPYLLKKNPQEYSRAEQFAWEQFNLRKLDWYPTPPEENK